MKPQNLPVTSKVLLNANIFCTLTHGHPHTLPKKHNMHHPIRSKCLFIPGRSVERQLGGITRILRKLERDTYAVDTAPKYVYPTLKKQCPYVIKLGNPFSTMYRRVFRPYSKCPNTT